MNGVAGHDNIPRFIHLVKVGCSEKQVPERRENIVAVKCSLAPRPKRQDLVLVPRRTAIVNQVYLDTHGVRRVVGES